MPNPYGLSETEVKECLARRDAKWKRGFDHYCQNLRPIVMNHKEDALKRRQEYMALAAQHEDSYWTGMYRDLISACSEVERVVNNFDVAMRESDSGQGHPEYLHPRMRAYIEVMDKQADIESSESEQA